MISSFSTRATYCRCHKPYCSHSKRSKKDGCGQQSCLNYKSLSGANKNAVSRLSGLLTSCLLFDVIVPVLLQMHHQELYLKAQSISKFSVISAHRHLWII